MAIDLKKARDFVYGNGVLWEKALFAYLFSGGSLDHLHACLLAYKNPDGGFGHGLEHDFNAPQSNPVVLEFLLGALVYTGVPAGRLLDGTAGWVERQRRPDGALNNDEALFDYPHMPWWKDMGGQQAPDSIVGNLEALGASTTALRDSTWAWVQANLSPDKIRSNEWLFMAYHACDFAYHVREVPDEYRAAVADNVRACAQKASSAQHYQLMRFVPAPDAPLAQTFPRALLDTFLDGIAAGQQDDGGWRDEHGLPQWYSWVTISNLLALRRWGRWQG